MAGGKKAKDKGKRYELEIANELKEYGYEGRRTAQFCGNPYKGSTEDASDVVGLDGVHIECKRYANKGFDYKWLEQAKRDCGEDIPTVFHRVDRKPTVVTMYLEDFIKLYQAYISGGGQ